MNFFLGIVGVVETIANLATYVSTVGIFSRRMVPIQERAIFYLFVSGGVWLTAAFIRGIFTSTPVRITFHTNSKEYELKTEPETNAMDTNVSTDAKSNKDKPEDDPDTFIEICKE